MPSWIEDIQGYTEIVGPTGVVMPRRRRVKFEGGLTVTDDGTLTHVLGTGATGATGPTGTAPAGELSAVVEQTVSTAGPHTTTLTAGVGRLTYSNVANMTLTSVSGATLGRVVLLYYSGTGSLTLTHSAGLVCDGAANLTLTQNQSALLVGLGGSNWRVQCAPARGRLLRAPQVLTGGTSITHPSGTRLIWIEGCGGGGAGGGVDGATGSGGAMGGSAAYARKTFTAASLTSTFVVGAGGTGVSAAAGNPGTQSTFTHNGLTVTCPPGLGGEMLAGGITVARALGGTAAAAPSNEDFGLPGQTGGGLERINAASAPLFQASPGGSTPLGIGARAQITSTTFRAGQNASGYGSGGGGDLNGTSTTTSDGGNGGPGVWIVKEYS